MSSKTRTKNRRITVLLPDPLVPRDRYARRTGQTRTLFALKTSMELACNTVLLQKKRYVSGGAIVVTLGKSRRTSIEVQKKCFRVKLDWDDERPHFRQRGARNRQGRG